MQIKDATLASKFSNTTNPFSCSSSHVACGLYFVGPITTAQRNFYFNHRALALNKLVWGFVSFDFSQYIDYFVISELGVGINIRRFILRASTKL